MHLSFASRCVNTNHAIGNVKKVNFSYNKAIIVRRPKNHEEKYILHKNPLEYTKGLEFGGSGWRKNLIYVSLVPMTSWKE